MRTLTDLAAAELIRPRISVGRWAMLATPCTSSAAVLAMVAITSSDMMQLPSDGLYPLSSMTMTSLNDGIGFVGSTAICREGNPRHGKRSGFTT